MLKNLAGGDRRTDASWLREQYVVSERRVCGLWKKRMEARRDQVSLGAPRE